MDSRLRDTNKILVLVCLYCLKCTKFDQLILRKMIKTVATTCQILRLKCSTFDFGLDSDGELTALPRLPSSIKGHTSKWREGKKRNEEGREKGNGMGKDGKGMRGEMKEK